MAENSSLCYFGASMSEEAQVTRPEITKLLRDWCRGDDKALEKLTPLIYAELHRLAHRYMRQERSDHTLQTTALINEAYLRLIDWKNVSWTNRAQFFAVAARMMRRILVDFARSRNYAKRGGGAGIVSLEDAPTLARDRAPEIVALDEALQGLSVIDPRKAEIVELRFFAGLGLEETAELLKVSSRTIQREWDLAKSWLSRELSTRRAGQSRPPNGHL